MNDDALRAPRGTYDILPPVSWRWQEVTRLALDIFAGSGYAPVDTPIFEHTEVFERGVGAATEVVGKQMYTFTDRAGRSLTLRPEGTAPVVRSVLEHNLERGSLPLKLSYAGPMFRQERPQKGRYRQFFQVGIEALGSDNPAIDAEVIEIGMRFLDAAGVAPALLLNSIGHMDASCREGYLETLVRFLRANEARLAPDDRDRIATNPLRTFDSKEEATVAVMGEAPLIADHLCDACRKHLDEVRALLDDLGIAYTMEPRLVRGLDYYTRTAFEYIAGGLGAQDAVGGGGRYDGLSEALGGPSLPGIGFALGIDRVLLATDAGEAAGKLDVLVVALGERAERACLKIVTRLRASGIAADLDLGQRSMKKRMRDAARSGARFAVIVGDEEVASGRAAVKDLATEKQEEVAFDDIGERVRR